MAEPDGSKRIDFARGVAANEIRDGSIVPGRSGGDDILVIRRGNDFFAVAPNCTHYGGPLAEGLVIEGTIRCPWHHACFSLRTGEALRPPALEALACWKVEIIAGEIYVRERELPHHPALAEVTPKNVVIIGGGAAGNAAAEMLRREGYAGRVLMLSAESDLPYDRPALSKDYLEGELNQDRLSLHAANFYAEHEIELLTEARVSELDCKGKTVVLENGGKHSFDALLIATGAEPVKLPAAGADLPHVCYLRSWKDCRAILAKAANATNVVVVGASFIAMEVAASLAQHHLKIQVVAPEPIPMAGILGPKVGLFLRHLHESKGTIFHLGQRVAAVEPRAVVLQDGTRLPADLVIVGIGVQPRVELAEAAGIKTAKGIVVNSFLETTVPSIFAAGDIARWPDPFTDRMIRVEHWVVAEQQGQTAALNILGRKKPFAAIPFFWTRQFDCTIHYNGHAEEWDQIVTDGSLEEYNCRLEFKLNTKTLAIATIGRDLESLKLEAVLENGQGK